MAHQRPPSPERQKRHRSGQTAELIAATYLLARGHRILARRFTTGAGEIDLITLKSGRIGFIEVKRRATLSDCEAAITPKLRQRVRAAGVLLDRAVKPQDWAKSHVADGLNQPVYSL